MNKLEKQITDYMDKNYANFIENPLFRIKATHILAIVLLLVSALVFTDNQIAIYIQLTVALAVFLHDFDDAYIKDQLAEKIVEQNKNQNFIEAIIDANKDAIIAIDEHQTVRAFNNSAEKMFGFSKDEMLNKDSLRKIIPSEQYMKHLSGSSNFFKTGTSAGFFGKTQNMEAKNKEGESISIRITLGYKQASNSKIIVANISSIEEIKEDPKTMYEQSRFAQMGEMIGNIAHQWRQPLTAISMIASSTKLNNQLGIASNDEIEKSLDDIAGYTNYLSQTIDVFRNYYSTDKIIKNFNLITIINDVLSMLDANLKDSYIVVFKEFQATNIECRGLPNELSQVLINVLNNARDVLVEKKVPSKNIKIVAYKQDVNAVIEIYDNGGGINNSIASKIFDPYFTTKSGKQTSAGMGLYMSKDIIENSMKGSLKASNANFDIGGDNYFGACFAIKLPAIMG